MSDVLSKEDYRILQRINVNDDELTGVLNRNGCANWTVCPECRVDDFSHIEGCSMHTFFA